MTTLWERFLTLRPKNNRNPTLLQRRVPTGLFGSNEQIILIIVSVSMFKSESLATVSMVWLLGRELSFVIDLHRSLKKSLNKFALTEKSVASSLFTRKGKINRIFETVTNFFKKNWPRSFWSCLGIIKFNCKSLMKFSLREAYCI